MARRALLTMYAGAHEAFRPVTFPTLLRFADRHGYELIEVEPVADGELYPAWSKLPALARALDDHEVVTWVDADVFVVDHTVDPASALDLGAVLAILRDERYGCCSAVFSLRSCVLARRLLADAWALRHGDYPDWDQGAIQRLVTTDPEIAAATAYLDASWFAEGAGPRIIHGCRQTAASVPARADALREQVRERVVGAV